MMTVRHSMALCLALFTAQQIRAQDATIAPLDKPVAASSDSSGIGWNNESNPPVKRVLAENKPTSEKADSGYAGDSLNRTVLFIPLRLAHFADVLFTLKKLYEAESNSGKLEYSFDERTNQLIIRSNESLLKEVQAVVEQLDSVQSTAEPKSGMASPNTQRDYSELRSQFATLIRDHFDTEQSELRQTLVELRRRLDAAEKQLGLQTDKKPMSNVDKLDKSVLSTMQAYSNLVAGELIDEPSAAAGRALSKSELTANEKLDLRQKLLELELRLMKAEALLMQRDKLAGEICEDRLNRMMQTMHHGSTKPTPAASLSRQVNETPDRRAAGYYLGLVLSAIETRYYLGKDHSYYGRELTELAQAEQTSSPDVRAYANFLIASLTQQLSVDEKNLGSEHDNVSVLKFKIEALKLIASLPDGKAINTSNVLEATPILNSQSRSEPPKTVPPRANVPQAATDPTAPKLDEVGEMRQADAYVWLVLTTVELRDSLSPQHPKYVEAVKKLMFGVQPKGSLVQVRAKNMKAMIIEQLRLRGEELGPEHPIIRSLKSKINVLDAMCVGSVDDFRSYIMGILNSESVVNPDKR